MYIGDILITDLVIHRMHRVDRESGLKSGLPLIYLLAGDGHAAVVAVEVEGEMRVAAAEIQGLAKTGFFESIRLPAEAELAQDAVTGSHHHLAGLHVAAFGSLLDMGHSMRAIEIPGKRIGHIMPVVERLFRVYGVDILRTTPVKAVGGEIGGVKHSHEIAPGIGEHRRRYV